ncbi:unnamed protein product [Trichogramma brassicae]|uniref:Sodium/calcium exchanger membrane region domain-containing protein n=1 Tax=Trichogramma brassicae TaxID=86971 RepID=A0A6H5I0F2_9HYME|nr:unnamed protein product [Trichogramma brassicae]
MIPFVAASNQLQGRSDRQHPRDRQKSMWTGGWPAMARRRRGSSIALRLALALAIPTLYCLFTSLAGYAAQAAKAGAFLSPQDSSSSSFSSADAPTLQSSRKLLQFVEEVAVENETLAVEEVKPLQQAPPYLKSNCTPPSIKEFPADGLTRSQRQHGFILIHVVIAIYSFLLLAIVCDDFFVPSITRIVAKLGVSQDVAGATFMAAASSSPELFINIVGTFVTEGDLGVGTIVGSAVFNILAVPACCGLFAQQVLDLDWWPVTRDSLAYGVTVILLIITLHDSRIEWYEAFVLVLFYILYILAEIVNMTSWPNDGFWEKCWWIFTYPINAVLLITIPDCRRPSLKNYYPLTFLMCVVWIALMSYVVGWDITIIGDTLMIPDSVMGLTFLAAGMSVPEAVSSVIVTNQGQGNMGISNSIGSNVFDVLLCLGLPWFIKSCFFPTRAGEHFVQINSDGLIYSSISLMSTSCCSTWPSAAIASSSIARWASSASACTRSSSCSPRSSSSTSSSSPRSRPAITESEK